MIIKPVQMGLVFSKAKLCYIVRLFKIRSMGYLILNNIIFWWVCGWPSILPISWRNKLTPNIRIFSLPLLLLTVFDTILSLWLHMLYLVSCRVWPCSISQHFLHPLGGYCEPWQGILRPEASRKDLALKLNHKIIIVTTWTMTSNNDFLSHQGKLMIL